MRNKLTEEKIKEIQDFYKSKPMSLNFLAEKFGFCIPTIRKALGDNVEIYPKNKIFNPNLNERFFEDIDDEYKAYFLGLIIADGNVYDPNDKSHSTEHKGSKWVSITLQDCDSYMLGIFRNKTGLSANVASDGRGSSYIAVRSTIMADSLEKYGIIQRKSFNTVYPPGIRDDLHRHVIRGIIDGDGSIDAYFKYTSQDNRNRFKHKISCCGTHRLMRDMIDIISSHVNLTLMPHVYDYRNRELSEFRIGNVQDMYNLGRWLYEGSNVFLKRKHDSFVEFSKNYNLEVV